MWSCFLVLCVVVAVKAQCDSPWVGDDCSIYSHPANPGMPYTGNAPTTKWKYYYINVLETAQVIATLTQDQSNADCDLDLYLQKDGFPVFENFMFRDISTDKVNIMHIGDAEGTYFFGVYGFVGCDYSFEFRIVSQCKCKGPENGVCNDGTNCDCLDGWFGDDCGTQFISSPSGQQNAKVAWDGWAYYGMPVNERPLRLQFDLMLGGEDDDAHEADLYIALNRPPTLWDYDYRTPDNGEDTVLNIVVSQPIPNSVYYMGVNARETSTFYVTGTIFDISDECVNMCSNHGTCGENVECACDAGFSGFSCETMDAELPLATSQNGFVGAGAWNYYSLPLDTLTNAVIYIEQKSDTSDCDVYVKKGNPPNFFNYDGSDFSFLQSFFVTIPSPGRGMWFIGVYGYTDCEYEVSVHEAVTCSCSSEAKGSCPVGLTTCLCQEGWGGDGCNVPIIDMTSGVVVRDLSVNIHAWQYFTLSVPKSIGLTIAVRETRTVGSLWLYVNGKEAPSLTSYDYAERGTNSALHQIDVISEFSGDLFFDNQIVIGVLGNPYGNGGPVSFDIVAWVTQF